MAFTVIPLHNIALDAGTRVEFAHGFVFQDLPKWLTDEHFLDFLARKDKRGVLDTKHAFVVKYEAQSTGEPDALWQGDRPHSIQETKSHLAILANLALWLRQPSNVCYTLIFHGMFRHVAGEPEEVPVVQQSERHSPIHVHPRDVKNRVTLAHVKKAAELHSAFCDIKQDNAVWEAMRALWAALSSYQADRRYSLFWIGLEALFGPDNNSGRITYKLALRISRFLANNEQEAEDLFRMVKKRYGVRSKIVHGRWKHTSEIDDLMADTESIIRTAIRHLLDPTSRPECFNP